jgi:acyl-CoA thioester hydrolase
LFSIDKRIYYHDTDSEGVVYYANYLKYLEEARTEHLLSLGIDLRDLKKEGALFAVADLKIKYRRPAKYGDRLRICSEISKLTPASILFSHKITREEALIIECETKLVSLGRDFKPMIIPGSMTERMAVT